MTHSPSRRHFLKVGAAAGGGLLLGFHFVPRTSAARAAPAPASTFAPNGFVRIDPNGTITLIMSHTEFGQGIYTSASMLIAEELEVGLDQITLEPAPPNLSLYKDPLLGDQATGGSTSTQTGWVPLRQAGAAARTMLIQAAAARWHVDPAACTAARGVVHHTASNRSLSYGQLADAAAKLPVPNDVKLKDAAAFTLIGKSQKRLDTPAKVNGTMQFGIDVQVPGMKIGTVAASPVLGGKLLRIDTAAARAVPGVRDVVQLDDVVAVIGDHMWAAITGLRAASPVWDDGPHASVSSKSLVDALAQASQSPGVTAKSTGDAQAAIQSSAKKLQAIYQLPFLAHAPMEPINTTIHIRPDGADVWAGTQVPVRAQAAVMKVTGLKAEQVTIHNQYMGGAFGRRLEEDSIFQAARIAKNLAYPVKLIWTREEDIQHDMYRPYYYDRIEAGLDDHGNITGWSHRVTGSSVTARYAPEGMDKDGKLDPDAVEAAVETPYDLPAQLTQYVRAEPPAVATSWWRGVGPTHNVFVVESFIDELASLAGQDPVEFRRRLLTKTPRALAVLNHVAEKSGWGGALPKGRGRGVAVQHAFNSFVASVAEVSVSDRGEITVHSVHTAVDCGPVVNPDTVEAQIQGGMIFGLSAALYSEITHTAGRVDQSNFHDYRVLRINEAPLVQVHIVSDPTAPIGGIGETGTASAAPALANAIFAATGRRLRRIPFATGQLSAA
jgi:isoquinoline 1-oxidoreductase beta subunit